ncbi:ribosomal protein L12 [Striga asiatica]|uniref:Ribosomal protein L12 n=1 Tax=Striga asiatica TaxID=4170 RepID=A0A5A7RC42_STRAF|nr:ribosomal protein L12 [Striga asiatica]
MSALHPLSRSSVIGIFASSQAPNKDPNPQNPNSLLFAAVSSASLPSALQPLRRRLFSISAVGSLASLLLLASSAYPLLLSHRPLHRSSASPTHPRILYPSFLIARHISNSARNPTSFSEPHPTGEEFRHLKLEKFSATSTSTAVVRASSSCGLFPAKGISEQQPVVIFLCSFFRRPATREPTIHCGRNQTHEPRRALVRVRQLPRAANSSEVESFPAKAKKLQWNQTN